MGSLSELGFGAKPRNSLTVSWKELWKWFIDGTNANAVGQKQLFGRTADSPDGDVKDVVNYVPHLE